MTPQMEADGRRALKIYAIGVFCFAIVEGFSINIFSNYLVDAYNVTDQIRGFIETPREFPGILCMFILPALVAYSDVTIAAVAAFVAGLGMLAMGVITPSFGFMVCLMFMYSMGTHLYYPLESSIGLSLAKEGSVGKTLGTIKGVSTFGYFVAAIAVFFGFRTGFFDFTTDIVRPFLLAAIFAFATGVCLLQLRKALAGVPKREKNKLIIKKTYMPYYLLTFAYGCQKRVRLVFALWVFAKLLGYKADFTAVLLIVSAGVGMIISPKMGKLMDKLGLKNSLVFESCYMIVVFVVFGIVAMSFANGHVPPTPLLLGFTFVLFILSDMTRFFEFFHANALKSIAENEADITPSFSFGQAVDHAMAITISPLFGVIWGNYGPQWVFWICAAMALITLYVGLTIKAREKTA